MNKKDKLNLLHRAAAEAVETKTALLKKESDNIISMAAGLARIIKKGGKLFLAGNGGSAADASHFATELIVRLTSDNDRGSLPAVALTADSSILTAAGNDYGFDKIFARQVEGLTSSKDGLILFSTSGNSANLIQAAKVARSRKVPVFSFLGGNGGKLRAISDHTLIVPSKSVQRIQEEHGFIIHVLVELMEQEIFK